MSASADALDTEAPRALHVDVAGWYRILAIGSLVAMLALRLSGPSDVYDQTQPKTIAYTTDIIVHGANHWILPMERGQLPATKPPLYNWLAVPCVALLGFNSEIAHKLPSIAAVFVCWAIIIRLGRKLDESNTLGWVGGLCVVANYTAFKLGYLARPDMLLTMWMLIGWVSATYALTRANRHLPRSSAIAAVFWVSVTLASLTKGPVALLAVVHAAIAARLLAKRWSSIRSLYPVAGSILTLAVAGGWALAVWQADPEHLRNELWFNEIYGRFTGTGSEGTSQGTREFFTELPYQTFYFATRFAPWSLMMALAMAALMFRIPARSMLVEEPPPAQSSQIPTWMNSAVIFILLTIGVFSVSIGKRADYVAVAMPQASLLAAWGLIHVKPRIALRAPWAIALALVATFGALSYYDHRQIWAPQPGFGDAIRRFIDASASHLAQEPGAVLNVSAGQSHLQAMLGLSVGDQRSDVAPSIDKGVPFWVVAGRTRNPPREFDAWIAHKRWNAEVEAVVRSEKLPRAEGWPGQVTLYRVTPGR